MQKIILTIMLSMSCSFALAQISFGFEQFTYGTLANNARDLASGDLNGDGKLDMVMADFSAGNVVVALGAGNGTFGAAQAYPVVVGFASQPTGIELGDFNNDGKLDVAVTTRRYQRLSIMLGDGTGLLGPPTHYFIDWMTGVLLLGRGSALADVVKGDFNGDSFLDLIVTDEFFQLGQIFIGTGLGTFTPGVKFSTGNPNFTAIAADFNNDEKLDLAVSESAIIGTGAISIFIGKGDGTFNPRTTFPTSNKLYTSSLAAADFNGDGNIDIAATNSGAYILGQVGDVSILIGDGTGNFGAATNYTTGVYPSDVVVSDVNLDGKFDLVVHHDGFDPGVGTPAGTGNISVLEGNGTGIFTLSTSMVGASSGLVDRVITGDFNNDARPDVASSGNLNILVINLNTTPCGSALPSPVIDSFTPTNGTPGTSVTINGSNFSTTPADNSIKFNGVNATVLSSNATSITAKVPLSATSGTISVALGCNIATSSSSFTITPPAPSITSFAPTSGKVGSVITITGINFNLTTSVSFGGTSATSFTIVSPTTVTAVVGSGTSGSVALTTSGGTTSLNGFTFIPPPTITSFSPTSSASGATITITGTNLTGATVVTFGGTAATAFNVVSPTSITAVVGTGSSGSVNVTTPGGTASLVGFTYIPPPAITSFTPTFGPIGTIVTLTGEGFDPNADNNIVKFNSVDAVVTASTTTSISTFVPIGATTGPISVSVGSLSATTSTAFVITTNPTGPPPEFTWVKQATGTGSQSTATNGNRIARDNSNNQYVTGGTFGTSTIGTFNLVSSGSFDVFVAKYDADGNVLWATQGGGTGDDRGSAIATDVLGNVYVTGFFNGTATFGSFTLSTLSANLFILKYNSDGVLLWAKQTISASAAASSSPADIDTDALGNVFITGNMNRSIDFGGVTLTACITCGTDIFTAKYDPSGNLLWAKRAGGNSVDGDVAVGLSVSSSGESYVTGYYYGTASFDAIGLSNFSGISWSNTFVAKYDASGNVVWAKGGGGSFSAQGSAIAVDNSGNVYAAGNSLSPFTFVGTAFINRGGRDTYLIKFDPMGNVMWSTQSIGSGSEYTNSLAIDGDNNLILYGYLDPSFGGVANFGGTVMSSAGSWDFFMAKYSENGTFQWALSEGGTGSDFSHGIEIGTNGEIFMAGTFSDSPTYGTIPLFSTPSISRLFVAKLGPCNTANSPTISSLTPTNGTIGTSVTITGTNFDTTPSNNIVTFNGVAATVTASTATSITTTVPTGATTGAIRVTVRCNTATSGSNFTIGAIPTILNFNPTSDQVGATVVITGTNFDPIAANNTVRFNGVDAAIPSVAASTSLTVIVPPGATTGPISVTTLFGTGTSATNFVVTCTPPSPPSPFNISRCGNGTVTLSATGAIGTQEYRWYDVASGGTSHSSLANFTTPPLTITTPYYVSIFDATTSCESNRVQVDAIVNTPPASPTSISNSGCSGTSIVLGASGGTVGNYRWYNETTGGIAFMGFVNDTYSTPILTSTTSFFVSIHDGTCESSRTEVIATVIASPMAPTVATVSAVCTGSTVILTATGGTNGQYRWYDGASLIAGEVNSTYAVVNFTATKTFQVALDDGTCESQKTSITVTLKNCSPPAIVPTTTTAFVEGIINIDLRPLISDPENDLDESSLQVVGSPSSGASFQLNGFILTLKYAGIPFASTDVVTLRICDQTGLCNQQELTIELGGEITVYNAISPNGDGKNETLFIQYIDILPDTKTNTVIVYNRWGDEVFSISDYNNTTRVFAGQNKNGSELPSGTYYYKIEFINTGTSKSGFISLKR